MALQTLADGQLAVTATSVVSGATACAGDPGQLGAAKSGAAVNLSLANTSGSLTETVLVLLSRQGGTNRRLCQITLAPNESAAISNIPMISGDTLLAQTTDATTVDYVVSEGGQYNGIVQVSTFDANGALKSTGSITAGTVSSNLTVAGTTTLTSASASALTVGRLGATTPALQVDASTAVSITGIKIKSAGTGDGVAISAIGEASNGALTIDAQGSGTITLGSVSTGNVIFGTSALVNAAGKALGYATGAGAAVTQGTNRTTGVTINAACGAITLISAAGSATPATFTVTNSAVAATDIIHVSQKSGTDLYEIFVTNVAAGSFKITSFTTGGTTTEQPVFNFAVIKGVAA